MLDWNLQSEILCHCHPSLRCDAGCVTNKVNSGAGDLLFLFKPAKPKNSSSPARNNSREG